MTQVPQDFDPELPEDFESAHREYANDTFGERGGCGFTFGNGCSGDSPADLFGQRKTTTYAVHPNRQEKLEVVE